MICSKFQRSEPGVKMTVECATVASDTERNDFEIWLSGDTINPYKASWWTQFRAVLWRSWLSTMKDPLLMKVRILQTTMIALIIGAIYYGQEMNQDGVMNINGVLFIFLTNMTFQNVFAVIHVFCSEIPLFLREHRNGMYRTDVYFLSKIIAEAPFFIVLPTLFTSVCYFMIGLNSEIPRFFVACGIVILVANVATSFGYMISCVSNSNSMALSLGPPLIIPSLLFGGFFLNVESIPIYFKWVSYLSWFKYGNEALMINQWENITEIDCPNGNSTCPRDGHMVLQIYNFHEEALPIDIISLLALIVGFRLIAYFGLLSKTYK
nr:protein white-like [Leptinotarsa decemlineata]